MQGKGLFNQGSRGGERSRLPSKIALLTFPSFFAIANLCIFAIANLCISLELNIRTRLQGLLGNPKP